MHNSSLVSVGIGGPRPTLWMVTLNCPSRTLLTTSISRTAQFLPAVEFDQTSSERTEPGLISLSGTHHPRESLSVTLNVLILSATILMYGEAIAD